METPQAELPSSSCAEREEGNSSAGTELSWQEPEPVSASAGYEFFGSVAIQLYMQRWGFMKFQWHDAKGKWLQLPIISLNLPSTGVHQIVPGALRGHKS